MIKHEKERLQKRLEEMQSLIPDTLEAMQSLPELEFIRMYITLNPGELCLRMDYNIKQYKVLRRELGSDWKWQEKRFNNYIGSYYIGFTHKRLDVLLDIQLDMSTKLVEGQLCRLVKIGERPVEPIFEVVCE